MSNFHRRRSSRTHAPAALLEALEERRLLAFNPTADEQYMLELLNRMRLNPAAELAKLTTSLGNPARSADAPTDAALRFFNTSGTVLAQQWATLTAAPALAWNEKLYSTAEAHNAQMILFDQQAHVLPGELDIGPRANAAGYTGWSNLGENIYAYAQNVFHGHAGFAIDWGTDANGIQDPPGHREDMMNPLFREVGIRITSSPTTPSRQTGPLVITQDFGRRFAQGNPFLLGVVFGDTSSDGYSPGEGLGGVTITAVAANGTPGAETYTTTTMSAGGWQMQLPSGTYSVRVEGAGFGAPVVYQDVVVSTQNVKLDAKKGVPPPAPKIQILGNGQSIADGDTAPALNDYTDLGNANRDNQTITRSFTVANIGNLPLNLTGPIRVRITGANASEFTLVQDAASTIAGAAQSTFTITFDPAAVGLRKATVTILSNDPLTPAFDFAIQGRGVKRAVLQVSGHQVPILPGDTTPTTADWTNFGGVDIQGGTKVRIFTVTNVGLLGLSLTGAPRVTLSGEGAQYFQVFQQPALTTLAPGNSTQFRVRFTAAVEGFASATLTVTSTDPAFPAYAFSIRGTGIPRPHLQVLGKSAIPIARNDDTPVLADGTGFGNVSVDAGSRVRQFTLMNTGLAALALTSTPRVTISGLNAGDFTVSLQPSISSIAPGQSVTFRVRFNPAAIGLSTAIINIASDDTLGALYSFSIRGTGV